MTALTVYRRCRRAGIVLAAGGNEIIWEAPADVDVKLSIDDIRHVKTELLFVLEGNYFGAALALACDVHHRERREGLAYLFDERLDICLCDGMARGDAERRAYVELCRAAESDQHDKNGRSGAGECRSPGAAGPNWETHHVHFHHQFHRDADAPNCGDCRGPERSEPHRQDTEDGSERRRERRGHHHRSGISEAHSRVGD
jgi:hypothetical protein